MGIFSRLTGKQPEKKSTDDQLLFHSMLCMAAADGVLDDSEIATVEAFILSLPEFRSLDFGGLVDHSKRLFNKSGGVEASVKELAGIESPAVRKKAFILAVDVALWSGDVDESEDQMLAVMQRVLDIDDAFAGKVIEVLSAKYAQ